MCYKPVVEEYVRCPHLLRCESEVLHPGILGLVPLEVVVIPLLVDTRGTLALHTSKSRKINVTEGKKYSMHLTFYCLSNPSSAPLDVG